MGSLGQFDVILDGELVASKSKPGLFARLLGEKGFPEESAVVAAVRAKLNR